MKTEILYVFSYMVTLAFHPSMCATIEVNRDEAIRKEGIQGEINIFKVGQIRNYYGKEWERLQWEDY